uniref:Uncharacterized protein n=1 Tax=Anguilla anguilla TaxID=7936 RepID=A0A0E9SBY2_ANGAN
MVLWFACVSPFGPPLQFLVLFNYPVLLYYCFQ